MERQAVITELYGRYFVEPASRLRKLHADLDALVLQAYGWGIKDGALANPLDLSSDLAELEANGKSLVGTRDPTHPAPVSLRD